MSRTEEVLADLVRAVQGQFDATGHTGACTKAQRDQGSGCTAKCRRLRVAVSAALFARDCEGVALAEEVEYPDAEYGDPVG